MPGSEQEQAPSGVALELYSTAFCGACRQTRAVLADVSRLVPGTSVAEFDVAAHPDRAEADGIDATPTVIVRDASGAEVFRASGVPSAPQVLSAVARALPDA